MKKNKKFFILSILLIFASFGFSGKILAATAKLTWNANSESDLAGYQIGLGGTPRSVFEANNNEGSYLLKSVGNVTNYKLYGQDGVSDAGTTYFAVRAYDTSGNYSDWSVEVSKLPGDMNGDKKADMNDFNTLASNFGNNVANCDQSANYNPADTNLDCTVDMNDFNSIATNFTP